MAAILDFCRFLPIKWPNLKKTKIPLTEFQRLIFKWFLGEEFLFFLDLAILWGKNCKKNDPKTAKFAKNRLFLAKKNKIWPKEKVEELMGKCSAPEGKSDSRRKSQSALVGNNCKSRQNNLN